MRMHLVLGVVIGFTLALCAQGGAPTAHAATFTVDSQTDAVDATPGDGICATVPLSGEGVRCTLRAAIIEANTLAGADRVNLPAGTYRVTIPGKSEDAAATGDFDVLSELTIVGAGRDASIIVGDYSVATLLTSDRVLDVFAGVNLTLQGLTVRDGFLMDQCGGALRSAGTVAIEQSAIRSSGSFCYGGAIQTSGTMSIIDSLVAESRTNGGSGGGISNTGTLTIVNSTVSQNGSFGYSHDFPRGGGIYNTGTLTISRSTISNNIGKWNGGALFNTGAVTIDNSTISGNSTQLLDGGSIVNSDSGFIYLTNSTIFANASQNGSGIVNSRAEPAVSLTNTIVANIGSGSNCIGTFTSLGYNLDTGASCGLTLPTDHPNTNAGLLALANNGGTTETHAFVAGSPAIDAGPPVLCPPAGCTASAPRVPSRTQAASAVVFCPAKDQRDQARPLDGDSDGIQRCDIGAYEAPTGRTVPASSCSPRPPVHVSTAPAGAGRISVTVWVTGSTNHLTSITFTTTNAVVDVAGQTGRTGHFTVPITGQVQQISFVVTRGGYQASSTVALIVNDTCGAWPTLVGMGAGVP